MENPNFGKWVKANVKTKPKLTATRARRMLLEVAEWIKNEEMPLICSAFWAHDVLENIARHLPRSFSKKEEKK